MELFGKLGGGMEDYPKLSSGSSVFIRISFVFGKIIYYLLCNRHGLLVGIGF